MKKSALLLILFLLPLVSAINLNMKENFKPGETLQAELEGNFLSPLTQDNVYFYSERLQIPLVFDIARIQDKYYIYALLPAVEKNYTILIKQAHFFENGLEQTQDIEKSFSVSGNITDFSITPGFVIASENFSITVESKNKALNIESKFLNQAKSTEVPAGQKRKIQFSVDKIENFTLTNIEISALNTQYEIPSAIIPPSKINETKKNVTEEKKFRFSNSEFNFSVNEDIEKTFSIYLINLGDELENIKINISDNLRNILQVSPKEIDNLNEADSQKIQLTVKTNEVGIFYGKIKAFSGNLSAQSDLIINSLEKGKNITQPSQSCLSLGGSRCEENQNCEGNEEDSSDGKCCIGNCTEKKSSTGLIIGIILIIAVIALIFFLYKKSKKGKASPEEILRKKQTEIETKITGKEVRGNLSR